MNPSVVLFQLRLEIMRYLRDGMGAFWTFAFPFLMLFLFMWMYAGARFGLSNDYLVTGMVGMTVIATCLFGFSVVLVELRSRDIFKMFHIFPIKKAEYLLAFIVSRVLILVVFCVIYLLVADLIYGISLRLDWLQWTLLLALLFLGSMCFLALGLALSSRLVSVTAATAAVNLLYFPLIFFSDLFYPQAHLPTWIAKLVNVLPLSSFVHALRAVIGPGIEWGALALPTAHLVAWLCVSLMLAALFFRWQNPKQ